jgi:lipopolysaccharide assembly protein A
MRGADRLGVPPARAIAKERCSAAAGRPFKKQEAVMRWFYVVVIVLIAAATLLFCVQNRDFATMSFLQFSIRAPLAILALVVYVLGAVTGGSLYALLRKSVRGAKRSDAMR